MSLSTTPEEDEGNLKQVPRVKILDHVGGTNPLMQLKIHPFEIMLALTSVSAALGYFFDPTSLLNTALATVLGSWVTAWSVMYGVSGLLILAGVLGRHRYLEMTGLLLLTGALLINLTSIVGVIGVIGHLSRVINLVIVATTCLIRLYLIWSRQDAVLLKERPL